MESLKGEGVCRLLDSLRLKSNTGDYENTVFNIIENKIEKVLNVSSEWAR